MKAQARNLFTNLHNHLDYCTFWLKRWGIIFAWIQLGKKTIYWLLLFFFLIQNCDSIEYYVLQEITLLIIWLIPQVSKINPTLWSDWLHKRAKWAYRCRSDFCSDVILVIFSIYNVHSIGLFFFWRFLFYYWPWIFLG